MLYLKVTRQKIIIIKHKLKLSYFYKHASLIKKSTHVTGTHNKMMDAAVIKIPWICLNGWANLILYQNTQVQIIFTKSSYFQSIMTVDQII